MVCELGIDIPVDRARHRPLLRARRTRRASGSSSATGSSSIRPEIISIAEQHKQEGPNLWERNPDRCCHVRKVEPLERVLKRLRRVDLRHPPRAEPHAQGRAARRVVSDRYDVWKVQPLVDWDAKRVDAYIHVNEIPYNPLHDAGYPSIGCIPCTRPVSRDEDERAGRWADSDKIECGIHTEVTRLHPLVHRPLRVRARRRSPSSSRPELERARPARRAARRRRRAHAPLVRARLLEGGPRREHRAHRLGRLAADPRTARR